MKRISFTIPSISTLFFLFNDPRGLPLPLALFFAIEEEGEVMAASWVGLETKAMFPSGKYFLGRPLFLCMEPGDSEEALTHGFRLEGTMLLLKGSEWGGWLVLMLSKGNRAVCGFIMVIETVFVNGLGPTSTTFSNWRWSWWGWGCGSCGPWESMKM